MIVLATLGPGGTCSEEVSTFYLQQRRVPVDSNLILCASFEEAVDLVLCGDADEVVVPAAYVNYHEVYFGNVERLSLRDILYSRPRFVLVERRDGAASTKPPRVACHRSPSPLLRSLDFPFVHVESASNSAAARLVLDGGVEMAVTNISSVNVIAHETGESKPLEIRRDFGTVDMIWAVFERRHARHESRIFWAASLSGDAGL